jgi:hypothetical protein
MKEDVCSSIFVDLKTVGRELGDSERSLFDAISCHSYVVLICCVGGQSGWLGRGRDVQASRSETNHVCVSEGKWFRRCFPLSHQHHLHPLRPSSTPLLHLRIHQGVAKLSLIRIVQASHTRSCISTQFSYLPNQLSPTCRIGIYICLAQERTPIRRSCSSASVYLNNCLHTWAPKISHGPGLSALTSCFATRIGPLHLGMLFVMNKSFLVFGVLMAYSSYFGMPHQVPAYALFCQCWVFMSAPS